MNLSDMVIDRGQNDIREWKIAEQLASGLLKEHPDKVVDGRSLNRLVSNEFKLDVVLKMAERTVPVRQFAKEIGVWPGAIYNYRIEYLAGDLGPVDDVIVEKLKSTNSRN